MPFVEQDAKALVGGDGIDRAEPKGEDAKDAPPAGVAAEDEEDGHEDSAGEDEDGEGAEEEHAGFVAVADGPADEVWVRLILEGYEKGFDDGLKGGWVSCVLQCVEKLRSHLV